MPHNAHFEHGFYTTLHDVDTSIKRTPAAYTRRYSPKADQERFRIADLEGN